MGFSNPNQTTVGAGPITLGRLLATLLKIGSIGFGGGMAIIALMSWRGYLVCGLSLLLLGKLRWHPAFVLAIGAAAGYFGALP